MRDWFLPIFIWLDTCTTKKAHYDGILSELGVSSLQALPSYLMGIVKIFFEISTKNSGRSV